MTKMVYQCDKCNRCFDDVPYMEITFNQRTVPSYYGCGMIAPGEPYDVQICEECARKHFKTTLEQCKLEDAKL